MSHRGQDTTRGPSQRQLRVAELIRRVLSETLARGDVHDAELSGVSITVGEVRVSNDLRQATAFVLPLGGANAPAIVEALNNNRAELRHLVTKQLTLKFSPELKFLADESFDRMDETRRLLERANVKRDLDPSDDEA